MSTQATQVEGNLNQRSMARYLLPRQADVIFIALFVGVIALGPRLMNMDGDLGRHLTIGSYILDELTIPTRDIFSFTMNGMHLTPHEWLAQVLFALSNRIAGLDGVVLLSALVLAVTFTIVYQQSLTRSRSVLVSLGITVLAAATASVHWLARPHIFTLLFTVLWVSELEKWRLEKKWHWWTLPLIMLIWVNFHGAFIVGILIWFIYLVGSWLSGLIFTETEKASDDLGIHPAPGASHLKRLLEVGVLVFLVTLINPAGWRVWGTTFGFLQNQYLVSHTVEYQSPNFQVSSFWPFLIMICLSIFLVGINRRRLPLVSVFLIVAWTAFGLISARNIAIYALVTAPIMAGIAATIYRDNAIFSRLAGFDERLFSVDEKLLGNLWPLLFTFLVVFVVILGAIRGVNIGRNRFSEHVFPVEAVDWIENHPPSEATFNYFPWGGYLLYRSWPDHLVFIDGQTDFYGERLTREYEKVLTLAEGWDEVLHKYRVNRVLMPTDSDLVIALSQADDWNVVYQDSTATVLDLNP